MRLKDPVVISIYPYSIIRLIICDSDLNSLIDFEISHFQSRIFNNCCPTLNFTYKDHHFRFSINCFIIIVFTILCSRI